MPFRKGFAGSEKDLQGKALTQILPVYQGIAKVAHTTSQFASKISTNLAPTHVIGEGKNRRVELDESDLEREKSHSA